MGDIEKIKEKYDLAKIPSTIYLGTLGRLEREMVAALLIELWKRKGEITPVTPREIYEMIKHDQRIYREADEEIKRRFEEEIEKLGRLGKQLLKKFLSITTLGKK
ncbi:MAG: hypothetical protein QME61_03320 [Patescibacteria group bacterium]|nr:hypothetical protein [Patescibacteria group bacterium]